MTLMRLGYWKGKIADAYPCPQELEGTLPAHVRERLIAYLDNPPLVVGTAYPSLEYQWGHSWCRYGCDVPNGSDELTDGIWVWPEGLSHYVKEHGLALLPEEFLESVVSETRRDLPASDEHDGGSLVAIDESAWVAWGRLHRSGALDAKLQEQRARCERLAVEALNSDGLERSQKYGTIDEPCWTEGCAGRALRINPLCGRCFAEAGGGHFARTEFREISAFLSSYRP
jgi:hypothetical protein